MDKRIVVFDIHGFGAQLKPAGLLVITDTMLNCVTVNWKKGNRTHVFIDVFHVVFENEFSAAFFNSAWRQFRKRKRLSRLEYNDECAKRKSTPKTQSCLLSAFRFFSCLYNAGQPPTSGCTTVGDVRPGFPGNHPLRLRVERQVVHASVIDAHRR